MCTLYIRIYPISADIRNMSACFQDAQIFRIRQYFKWMFRVWHSSVCAPQRARVWVTPFWKREAGVLISAYRPCSRFDVDSCTLTAVHTHCPSHLLPFTCGSHLLFTLTAICITVADCAQLNVCACVCACGAVARLEAFRVAGRV